MNKKFTFVMSILLFLSTSILAQVEDLTEQIIIISPSAKNKWKATHQVGVSWININADYGD